MRKIHLLYIIIVLVLAIAGSMWMMEVAYGHEGHGFKHMVGNSGPIIRDKPCPGTLTNLWYIDYDGDGIVDVCKEIFFAHDRLHVKEKEPVDNECKCWEEGDE